jgi:hypothetical protein
VGVLPIPEVRVELHDEVGVVRGVHVVEGGRIVVHGYPRLRSWTGDGCHGDYTSPPRDGLHPRKGYSRLTRDQAAVPMVSVVFS